MSKIKLMTAEEMEEKLAKESGIPGVTVDEVSKMEQLINNLYEARKKGDTTSDGWFYNRQIALKPQMIEHLATLGYEVENKITCGYDDVSYYYTSIRVKPSSSSKKRKQ
jgi:acetate kinase